jgi:hypothetical protein
MKRIFTLKKAMSLLLSAFMAVSVTVTAGAAVYPPTQADDIELKYGYCSTETAEDGTVYRSICIDLIYNDESLNKSAVFESLDVEAAYSDDEADENSIEWKWDNSKLMASAACTKADDGTVINEPYVYSKFLILKTDKDKDFYVVLNTPDGYSVLAEYSHEAERSLPIELAEDAKLRRLPILSGDADGNGRITANDAMKMMRYSIRLEDLTSEQLAASDVNNDGKVNAKDSLATLRFTIGYKDKGTVFAN